MCFKEGNTNLSVRCIIDQSLLVAVVDTTVMSPLEPKYKLYLTNDTVPLVLALRDITLTVGAVDNGSIFHTHRQDSYKIRSCLVRDTCSDQCSAK